MPALLESNVPGVSVRRGKVRDVYDLGDKLLLVATDRISAFDWVMPSGIPDKGRILTQLSAFWFDLLDVPSHVISTDIGSIDLSDALAFDWSSTIEFGDDEGVKPGQKYDVVLGRMQGKSVVPLAKAKVTFK